MITKLREHLRRDGPLGLARAVGRRIGRHVYLHERHVWYECDLADRPRRELPQETRLVRASVDQLRHVARLGQSVEDARARLATGNDIWLVMDGDEPLFSCTILRGTAPVLAAPGGTLEIPEGAVCLEDSIAAPAARGRGIAPGAWTAIGDHLQREGVRAYVTKIETGNVASRKAVEKVGFKLVAEMDHQRVGPRRRTRVQPVANGVGKQLAARLSQ